MEPPILPSRARVARRNHATLKLLFIAGLIFVLQIPLHLVNNLRQERSANRQQAVGRQVVPPRPAAARGVETVASASVFDAYRMIERALKHGVLVLALIFTAFFLFEMLAGLRLHAVHYGLVGAALCLFYLALLALGEVLHPTHAYVGAATASSALISLYSAAILQGWFRAGLITVLLALVHSVLFVVLRMEDYALLAGTTALFVALAAVMFFTRRIDWQAHDAGAAQEAAL